MQSKDCSTADSVCAGVDDLQYCSEAAEIVALSDFNIIITVSLAGSASVKLLDG